MTNENEAETNLAQLADIKNWWTEARRDRAREDAAVDFERYLQQRKDR